MNPETVAIGPVESARRIIDACQTIAGFSDDPANITRTYLSPASRCVHEFLLSWMSRLDMQSRVDAVGNLRGVHRCGHAPAPRLLIGSHIDTVPNAGAYDGVLGVVLGLALIEGLADRALDYDIEVVAFSEEEGVRFGVPFIGSRALIGDIDDALLAQTDADGSTVREAIAAFGLDSAEIPAAVMDASTMAYIEFHIEQGPVLESLGISLGIVEAISGQSRYDLTFYGNANHAGTTPMRLRRDALAGAAEWIVEVEREAIATAGLVATVGRIHALPGAANVIPGEVRLTLDVRHATDPIRLAAAQRLLAAAHRIASVRGLHVDASLQVEQPATEMHSNLAAALEQSAAAVGIPSHRMVSGAGHDAMVLATKIPAAMLFLRSPGGISHHPDEAVLPEDLRAAIEAGLYFLQQLDATALALRNGRDIAEA